MSRSLGKWVWQCRLLAETTGKQSHYLLQLWERRSLVRSQEWPREKMWSRHWKRQKAQGWWLQGKKVVQ